MTTSNSPEESGVGTNTDSATGQAVTEAKVVPEKDYLESVAFGTKARQAEIALAKRLVEKDKSELANITDKKVKDSVVKDLFGYSDYEEMVAIEGEASVMSKSEGDEDELTILKKQIRTLTYKSEKGALEDAISNFKERNPSYFKEDGAEEKLRSHINLISWELPFKDRIEMAGRIAFTETISSEALALKALASSQVSTQWGGTEGIEAKQTDNGKKTEDLMKYFGLKK